MSRKKRGLREKLLELLAKATGGYVKRMGETKTRYAFLGGLLRLEVTKTRHGYDRRLLVGRSRLLLGWNSFDRDSRGQLRGRHLHIYPTRRREVKLYLNGKRPFLESRESRAERRRRAKEAAKAKGRKGREGKR